MVSKHAAERLQLAGGGFAVAPADAARQTSDPGTGPRMLPPVPLLQGVAGSLHLGFFMPEMRLGMDRQSIAGCRQVSQGPPGLNRAVE